MTTTASGTAEGIARAPLARAFAIGTPMTPVGFYPRAGLLPAVTEVRGQTGPWDAVGQRRQLMLSDGGSVTETLVEVDSPRRFVYELSNFERLFGLLVSGARAEWEFSADQATTTRIRWRYTFFARPGAGFVLRAIVRFLWAPYMRRVLPGIIAEIDRSGPY